MNTNQHPDMSHERSFNARRQAGNEGASAFGTDVPSVVGSESGPTASVTPTLGGVRIECGGCAGAERSCGECFIGFLTSRDADDAVVFDVVEERALRTLREGGLLGTVVERRPLGSHRIA